MINNPVPASAVTYKVSLKKDLFRYGKQFANIVMLPQAYLTHADCVIKQNVPGLEAPNKFAYGDYYFVLRLHSDRNFNLRELTWEYKAELYNKGSNKLEETWEMGGLKPYAFPTPALDIVFGAPVDFVVLGPVQLPHNGATYKFSAHLSTATPAYFLDESKIQVEFKTPLFQPTLDKLDTPTNFKAKETEDGEYVELSWDPVPGATFYKLHAAFDKKAVELGFISQLDYDFLFVNNQIALGTTSWPPGIACTFTLRAYSGTTEKAMLSDATQLVFTRPGVAYAYHPNDAQHEESLQQSIIYVKDGDKRRLAQAYIKTTDAAGNPIWRPTT